MYSNVGRQFGVETGSKDISLLDRNDVADVFFRVNFGALDRLGFFQSTGQNTQDVNVGAHRISRFFVRSGL